MLLLVLLVLVLVLVWVLVRVWVLVWVLVLLAVLALLTVLLLLLHIVPLVAYSPGRTYEFEGQLPNLDPQPHLRVVLNQQFTLRSLYKDDYSGRLTTMHVALGILQNHSFVEQWTVKSQGLVLATLTRDVKFILRMQRLEMGQQLLQVSA